MTGRAILVKACLNGGRSRAEHPLVPITPDEIAAEAEKVARAGAGAVHVHPRKADGAETFEPEPCAAVVEAVRSACPGLLMGFTTGAWIEPDLPRRLAAFAAWDPSPDFASVNFSEQGAVEVCRVLLDRGIGVEAGLTTLLDARAFITSGLGGNVVRALVEPQDADPQAAVARARAIDRHLEESGVAAPRLHHGQGRATWAVLGAALAMGRDVRVGLEDTLEHADGTFARDNEDLVATVVRMADRHGLNVASRV